MAQPLTGDGTADHTVPGDVLTVGGPALGPPVAIGFARTARLFARLRTRFLINNLRGRPRTSIPVLLSFVGALAVAALGVAIALGLHTASVERATVIATVAASAMGFAALVGPVSFAGVDDSLSPSRLAPYPLSRPRRLAGLVAATAVSPLTVGTTIAIVAVAAATCRSPAAVPLVVVATVGLWLQLIVISRLLATAMARLAATRRGRDLTIALGALVAASGWAWAPLARAIGGADFERLAGLARVLRWLPPGALGRAMVTAGAGSLLDPLAGIGVGLAGLGVIGAGWWSVLGRGDVDGGAGGASPTRVEVDGLAAGMFSGALRHLPRTVTGAVAARELKYLVRDPRQRAGAATLVILAVVLPVLNVSQRGRAPALTMLGSSAGLFATFAALNQLGTEGKALWIHLLSGLPGRDYLRGKSLALVVYLVPLVLATSTVIAALTGGWVFLPAAALVGVGSLLAGIGVGTVSSVRAPIPVPEGTNPFATTGGEGCVAGLLTLLSVAVVALIMSPASIALFVLRHHPAVCAAVGLVSLVYGAAVWAGGQRLAVNRLAGREPELVGATAPNG